MTSTFDSNEYNKFKPSDEETLFGPKKITFSYSSFQNPKNLPWISNKDKTKII